MMEKAKNSYFNTYSHFNTYSKKVQSLPVILWLGGGTVAPSAPPPLGTPLTHSCT